MHAITWLSLEKCMLSERSPTQLTTYYMITFKPCVQKGQRQKVDEWLPRAGQWN